MKKITIILAIAAIFVLNIVASTWFFRIDLTEEKRYSLSPVSEEVLNTMRQPLFIDIYLDGDFPARLRNYQDVIRTTLIEMNQYASTSVDFTFTAPDENPELMKMLQAKGFAPQQIKVRRSATEVETRPIWPVAVLRHGDQEEFIDFFRGAVQGNGYVDFARAEENLEYRLISAVRNISRTRRPLVAILQGHGEHMLEPVLEESVDASGRPIRRVVDLKTDMPQLIQALNGSYDLAPLNLQRDALDGGISPTIRAILVFQPKSAFTEREKYELDQYIMRGGNVLFVMDQQTVDLDLYKKRATLSELAELNLDDLFMNYGFRINYNLLQDARCEKTEVFQEINGKGVFDSKFWVFFPMIQEHPRHPINRNIEAVMLRYASTIDTLYRKGVTSNVFLQSSPRSRTVDGRQFIDLEQYLQAPPPPSLFNKGPQVTGLVQEGHFQSLFTGRSAPLDSIFPNPPSAQFIPRSDLAAEIVSKMRRQGADQTVNDPAVDAFIKIAARERRIAVISDGDLPLGKHFQGARQNIPYDNLELILNAVDYLVDDLSLASIRSKEVAVRALDDTKILKHEGLIKAINLGVPLLLVALFGLFWTWRRKRKYSVPSSSK
ncbi:MAG: Gldg family protein [Bacteroidia bacterium]